MPVSWHEYFKTRVLRIETLGFHRLESCRKLLEEVISKLRFYSRQESVTQMEVRKMLHVSLKWFCSSLWLEHRIQLKELRVRGKKGSSREWQFQLTAELSEEAEKAFSDAGECLKGSDLMLWRLWWEGKERVLQEGEKITQSSHKRQSRQRYSHQVVHKNKAVTHGLAFS